MFDPPDLGPEQPRCAIILGTRRLRLSATPRGPHSKTHCGLDVLTALCIDLSVREFYHSSQMGQSVWDIPHHLCILKRPRLGGTHWIMGRLQCPLGCGSP